MSSVLEFTAARRMETVEDHGCVREGSEGACEQKEAEEYAEGREGRDGLGLAPFLPPTPRGKPGDRKHDGGVVLLTSGHRVGDIISSTAHGVEHAHDLRGSGKKERQSRGKPWEEHKGEVKSELVRGRMYMFTESRPKEKKHDTLPSIAAKFGARKYSVSICAADAGRGPQRRAKWLLLSHSTNFTPV
jgi:hypothetical protein